MMKKLLLLSLFLCFLSALILSCNKDEEFDNNPGIVLGFSQDTILFDTIFTTVGSATQAFKVYNPSDKKIIISSIRLGKGESSPYRFNIDGNAAIQVNDIEIDGKDSAFVFVKVTIDPNNANSPLIQQDSLIFKTNNNIQDIKLVAWGQDAYFYNRGLISSDYIFEADKPHVIYNYLIVDSLNTLEVKAGARIHLHPGAFILVYNSASIKIKGTADAPVIIEGDRLEDAYKDMTGQWDRIWLYAGSINNEIDYAIIKNGSIGLQVDTIGNSTNPTLKITNSVVYNMRDIGLLAQGTTIEAANCVFANSSSFALALTLGGSYDFRHCTIANYWPNFQDYSGLVLNNYYIDVNKNVQVRPLEKAYFGNCIIYGYQNDELNLDQAPTGSFNYTFDHCLIKTRMDISDPTHFINSIKNSEPYFNDPDLYEFEPDSTLSAVINTGSIEVVNSSKFDISKDIRQKSRIEDQAPDIGAYEFDANLTIKRNR
jgi:hypothetical protein